MELRHLRYFAAVAAHGSFSRAANQLHLTQPALSRQVKSLEDEIGVALIVRGQNTISLTSAGEDFYEEAKDILARVGLAIRRIKTRPPGEKLRIGYVHSLTAGIMPRVVERFQSYNKDVFLELSDLRRSNAFCSSGACGRLDQPSAIVKTPTGYKSPAFGLTLWFSIS